MRKGKHAARLLIFKFAQLRYSVSAMNHGKTDVVGVGINATDTILRLRRFPTLDSKVEILSSEVKPGGQVAGAMVACRRWGMRARYIGKIANDDAGKLQVREMKRERVRARWIRTRGASSQTAYILIHEPSGERTVLWKRDPAIAIQPADLKRHFISGAKILLVDGHDTAAATQAARWACEQNIPVVADLDNLYSGVEALLHFVPFPITSQEFPERLTGEKDLLKSLPSISSKFKCRLIAATLGRLGVIAWEGSRFILCPAFRVRAIDTTGAGDIFHGAFIYGLAHHWPIREILEFSCAAAAINCMAPGARGRIATLTEIAELRAIGERSEFAFSHHQLHKAAAAARHTK